MTTIGSSGGDALRLAASAVTDAQARVARVAQSVAEGGVSAEAAVELSLAEVQSAAAVAVMRVEKQTADRLLDLFV